MENLKPEHKKTTSMSSMTGVNLLKQTEKGAVLGEAALKMFAIKPFPRRHILKNSKVWWIVILCKQGH